MEVLRDLDSCPAPPEGCAVTIGAYDGVHLGHRAVIDQVRRRATEGGLRSALVTFDRHPAAVVRPESAPRLLTDLEQKLELVAATGIDYCLVLTFDEVRSKEPAEEFVHEVLRGCLNARVVIVGHDFHFGHRRRGNVDLLRRLGPDLGFEVDDVDLVDEHGRLVGEQHKVSSTTIRHALASGDLDTAHRLLGRPHEVRGVVAHGDKRGGAELGFPTANVSVPGEILLPADGIYAGWFERADGTVLPAAISLGRRPTFYAQAHASLLEAHVLDFSGDLYGESVKVRFVEYLRGEERFDSVDALIEQMQRDVERTRLVLADGAH